MRAKKKLKIIKNWIKIRDLLSSITKNSDDYDKKYTKSKFNSREKLLLNKTIEIPTMAVVVRVIFYENNKYYLQVFLDKYLYKIENKNEMKNKNGK